MAEALLSDQILGGLLVEIRRQLELWDEQNHTDFYWLGILGEEFGEVAKALIENEPVVLEKELFEVAAVALLWLECIVRDEPRVLKPGFARREK